MASNDSTPNMPRLEMVKVPVEYSSGDSCLARARLTCGGGQAGRGVCVQASGWVKFLAESEQHAERHAAEWAAVWSWRRLDLKLPWSRESAGQHASRPGRHASRLAGPLQEDWPARFAPWPARFTP